jgi:hypothetical protein
MATTLTLDELGVDDDPGTSWHPRADKYGDAWDADGRLVDLTDDQVDEHATKPEAAEQPDSGEVLAAEDSAETPGEVI